MRKILLKIAYDGSMYYGWQRQNNFITVQQRVEEALSRLMKEDICVRGSSRTDTGVHALGQGAVFDGNFTIPTDRIPYALNSFLPPDIVCRGAREVDNGFHPQYSVINKTYRYRILNEEFPNPLLSKYTDFIPYSLNIDHMRRACDYFIGKKDFKAFCASGSTAKTTEREIFSLTAEKKDNIIDITVTGSGFLYNMVRIIAGTLVYVGLGKIKPEDIESIIAGKDRTQAGKTLAPGGLTLMNIVYDFSGNGE